LLSCWRNMTWQIAKYGRLAQGNERQRAPRWWKPWRRDPWWWRFNLKCLGWYDCADEWLGYPEIASKPNWYERRCLRRIGVTSIPKIAVSVPSTGGTDGS
jgi:hypothetical protein